MTDDTKREDQAAVDLRDADPRDAEIEQLREQLRAATEAAQPSPVAMAAGAPPPDPRDEEIAALKAKLAEREAAATVDAEEPHRYTLVLANGQTVTAPNVWATHHFHADHGTIPVVGCYETPDDAPAAAAA